MIVVGLGAIGRRVCQAVDAGLPGVTLVAATARDRARGEAFLKSLGTPVPFVTLDELVLYELHVGAFTDEGTFDAAIPRLRALREVRIEGARHVRIARCAARGVVRPRPIVTHQQLLAVCHFRRSRQIGLP